MWLLRSLQGAPQIQLDCSTINHKQKAQKRHVHGKHLEAMYKLTDSLIQLKLLGILLALLQVCIWMLAGRKSTTKPITLFSLHGNAGNL